VPPQWGLKGNQVKNLNGPATVTGSTWIKPLFVLFEWEGAMYVNSRSQETCPAVDMTPSFGREGRVQSCGHIHVLHPNLNPCGWGFLRLIGEEIFSMNIKKLVLTAVLIALSVVGTFIKIPSMVGSLAFDAVPGFYAALAISPVTGAIVAGFGHVATALYSGIPLGLPVHALVVLGMMLAAYLAGTVAKLNIIAGCVVGIAINGIVLPATFIIIPGFGIPFFIAAGPSIVIAAALNMLVAFGLTKVTALRKLINV